LDAFLIKLDPSSGAASKAFAFGDPGTATDQVGIDLAVAQAGNVVVAGTYYGEIDFTALNSGSDGSTAGKDYLAQASLVSGAPMGFYVVVDGTSSGQYATTVLAHNVDLGNGSFLSVASNPSHDKITVCGKTSRLVGKFNATNVNNTGLLSTPPQGEATPTYGGAADLVVAVIDASTGNTTSGSVLWGRQFGGAGDQVCQAVAIDGSGKVTIAGTYNGTLDFGNGHVLTPVPVNPSLAFMYVAQFDENGVAQGHAGWGGTRTSFIKTIVLDSSSNLVIAGDLQDNVDFGTPVGALNWHGKYDGFVVKLSSSLAPLWGVSFGDDNQQNISSVNLTSAGDVVVGGAFGDSASAGGVQLGLGGYATQGGQDGFVAQFAGSSGSLICARPYGDAVGDQSVSAVSVASSASGDLKDSVMMGGEFSNTLTLGNTTLLSPGTSACSDSSPCPTGSTCTQGYCVNAGVSKSFLSGLGP
jgi:hypothetical protein